MPHRGPYNELEYLTLALISEGLGSGYAIRKAMNHMRGGRWSSESGSVYRVLRRLRSENLIKEAATTGSVNHLRIEYALTGQGDAVLSSWLTLPPDSDEFAYLVDPIRTRSYFLTRLEPEIRAGVLEGWLRESERFCKVLEDELDRNRSEDALRDLSYRNLLYLARARSEWLTRMLEEAEAPAVAPIGATTC